MKTESEIRDYLEKVKKQTEIEIKSKHYFETIVGKTVLSTLMWVLGEISIDLNRLEDVTR